MTTAVALRQAADSAALSASAVPTVVLDRQLRIQAVNPAYEQVSLRNRETLLGQEVFTVFPDNPTDPAGAGSGRLLSSLERVLARGERHHLGFLRYDIADPDTPEVYQRRMWSPVNSPIFQQGRTVGVMEQVEDVTALAYGTDGDRPDGNVTVNRLAAALSNATTTLAALRRENDQLRHGLATNRLIGVAIGVLMKQHKLTRDQAFDLLRFHSQHSNRKVRDIAEYIADTGTLPAVRSTGSGVHEERRPRSFITSK